MTSPVTDFPQVVITSVTRDKLSRAVGYNDTTVSFTFTQPVLGWMVRINSTGPFDGTYVAEGEVEQLGFGQIPFGTGPFGGYIYTDLINNGTITITSDVLHEGSNDVAIYGRSANGWSYRTPV